MKTLSLNSALNSALKSSFVRASALLMCALGALGCYTDPEDFCKSKVESVCNVLAGCCNSKSTFDMEDCKLSGSSSCMSAYNVQGVHAGDIVFDPGAADSCIGSINSCDDLTTASKATDDRVKACGNALTGYRPAGSACGSSSDCAKDGGDFPYCYQNTICAKAVFSQDTCGFSLENYEFHTCVSGKYCDPDEKKFDPAAPPTAQSLEFTGTCKAYPGKGGKCVPDGNQPIACAEGYYCDYNQMDPKLSVCAAQKGAGAACNFDGACKADLACLPGPMGDAVCTETKAQEVNGPYCFVPAKCGDGVCADGESASCPQDCVQCGDGVCDTNANEPASCPIDCCGDGFCDTGETIDSCPDDCI